MNVEFDIFEWHAQFQSCVRYFLDHAQHTGPVQAVAAFLNIQLPFQKPNPVFSSVPSYLQSPRHNPHGVPSSGLPGMPGPGPASLGSASGKMPMPSSPGPHHQAPYVTLTPYIRRLVATGFDIPSILHGFFGDDWAAGVGSLHEAERRNYLFAAKSDNWLKVKADYDMDGNQMIPFLKPLQNVSEHEIVGAETSWSEWLAMQDWMLGPRAPMDVDKGMPAQQRRPGQASGVRIKREEQ